MDLVAGAKRVIVAMQHTARGHPKIVYESSLPLTSNRPVDLVITELAVIGFPNGRTTLLETLNGVTVEEVVAATEAKLAISDELSGSTIPRATSETDVPLMGEAI
jgi:acetate CoA/acetoacetate CoA-transferase beta subunit